MSNSPDYTAAFKIIAEAVNLRADQLAALDRALGLDTPDEEQTATDPAADLQTADDPTPA